MLRRRGALPIPRINGVSVDSVAIATQFEHPLGNGTLWTEANDSRDSWRVDRNFGERISSGKVHLGEDWNNVSGGDKDADTTVNAAATGRVIFAGEPSAGGWGGAVIIAHHMMDGSWVETRYGHLQLTSGGKILLPNGSTLSVGQDVSMGQDIGKLAKGSTFSSNETAHLHFEVHIGLTGDIGLGYASSTSGFVDPTDFLRSQAFNVINGRSTSENLRGTDGKDLIDGNGGSDVINPRGGADIVRYDRVSDSTGSNFDSVLNFDTSMDKFDFSFTVRGVESRINGGKLRAASFDKDLASAVSASKLDPYHAVTFTPSSGDYNGHTFLIVDANGKGGYQAGQDFVIDLVGGRPIFDPSDFI